jgi:hypothetical protein
MKRRTIDLVVSAAGLVIAAILLVLGFVLTSNANFAKNYVHDQLAQEQITFKTADTLTDLEKAKPCLVQYAGQQLLTGKQAECYANNFIGLHLSEMGAGTPYAGHSYATLGDDANALKAQIKTATTAGDTAKVTDLNKTLTAVNSQRDTVFKGEMLRGVLLTSYGFSELGTKAAMGATVAYAGGGLMFLLGLLGFWHGLRTSPAQAFAPVEEARREKSAANA